MQAQSTKLESVEAKIESMEKDIKEKFESIEKNLKKVNNWKANWLKAP
jgi:hypothetical protein